MIPPFDASSATLDEQEARLESRQDKIQDLTDRILILERTVAVGNDALALMRSAAERLARQVCHDHGRNPDATLDENGIRVVDRVLQNAMRRAAT